ncbi:MAG: HEAT repeat domain-containing protein [Mycobacterium leprae]
MSEEQGALAVRLRHEVERFRAWAETVEHEAEWEEEYPGWGDLYNAVRVIVRALPPEDWTPELQQDLLYAMARDREGQVVQDELIDHPAVLFRLVDPARTYPDYEARWQAADALGQISESPEESTAVLRQFVQTDEHEYVRRRALLAMGYRDLPGAESLALAAWETGEEYQRMAALTVLAYIDSPHLAEKLSAAEHDPSEAVRGRAAAIREQVERGEIQ